MTITMLSFTSFSSVASYLEQNAVFHRYVHTTSLPNELNNNDSTIHHHGCRERASGMYVALSYFVSKVIVAFSFIAVLVAIGTTRLHPFSNQSSMLGTIPFERREKANHGWWWWTECTIVYWMVGLRSDVWHYFAFFVFVITLAAWSAEVRYQHMRECCYGHELGERA
jgi:hypothetical protein